MSYIQIDFNGVKRGLKFNQMTLHVMEKFVDKNAVEVTSGYALIYAGLYCNAYQKREELDLTFEQVCDLCDKLTADQLNEIQAAWKAEFDFEKDLPKEVKKKKAKVKGST